MEIKKINSGKLRAIRYYARARMLWAKGVSVALLLRKNIFLCFK